MLRIAEKAAGAGVHGCHHHEGGRVGDGSQGAADGDLAVLQGLTQHLQDIFFELGEFVEK